MQDIDPLVRPSAVYAETRLNNVLSETVTLMDWLPSPPLG